MKGAWAILIKPGSGCNLDCGYCFWERKGHDLMGLDLMREMVRQYEEVSALRAYVWQGEPTEQPLDFYREFARVARPNVPVAFQTNGVKLTEEWVAFLRERRWLVGLSVDGMEGPRPVRQGLLELRMSVLQDAKIPTQILCLVNRANVEHGAEIARYFARHAQHIQFIAALPRFPGDREHSVTGSEMAAFLRDARAADSGITIENYRQGREQSTCETGHNCGSYLVVTHDGSVYPCDFFAEPRWKLGTIQDDGLRAIVTHKRALKEFRKLSRIPAEGCEECSLLEVCGRGCPRSRYVDSGDYRTKDPLCEMRKEVLR